MDEFETLDMLEVIDYLRQNGFGDIVDALLNNDAVYTCKGRINKSAACRLLKLRTSQLEARLQAAKELLEGDNLS